MLMTPLEGERRRLLTYLLVTWRSRMANLIMMDLWQRYCFLEVSRSKLWFEMEKLRVMW